MPHTNTPRPGVVTALVGGVMTILGGLFVIYDISVLFGFLGILMGFAIAFLGMVGYAFESSRRVVGVVLIAMAILALVPSLSGLFIGFVFTIVSGYVFLTVGRPIAMESAIICPS